MTEIRRQRRPSLLLRAFPSLTDVAFLMPLIFVFVKLDGAKTLLGDGDTGWHIRAGDWILANGAAPRLDLFSYTKNGQEWFAWEWLWDAAFAGLHASGGLAAVVLASLLAICLTCALLYRITRDRAGNVLVAIVVTLLATAAMSIHWLARPHLFTLLFGVILYRIVDRTHDDGRFGRLMWTLPLMVLWANTHGGFLAGLLVISCYLGGDLALAATTASKQKAKASVHAAGRWALTLVGCLAVTILNPYGWRLHQHIYAYLTESYHFRFINEFQSLSFQSPAAVYFELMLVLGAGAVALCLVQRRFAHVFLLLGWGHLALVSARNIPLFALFAAPLAAEALAIAIQHLREARLASWVKTAATEIEDLATDIGRTDAPGRLHVASAAGFGLLALLMLAPDAGGKLRAEYDPKAYPEAAIAAMDGLSVERIFASDEWGDYLIYRRYPALQVFIDGRSDFYGSEFGVQYLDTMSVQPGWQAGLDDHQVDTVLLSVKASLAGALKESATWKVVYDDGVAVIFQRRGSSLIVPGNTQGEETSLDRSGRSEHETSRSSA